MKVNHSISRFRPASWFEKTKIIPPQVYIFRNLEYGQVLYSQFPNFSQTQVDKLFVRPNWSNRKPSLRRDIWKCMCVVNLQNYKQSVHLYQNLCRLRYLRDVAQRKESDKLRKKDSNGHVWYSGQYRPTYCQEAVADLRESLLKVFENATPAEKQTVPAKNRPYTGRTHGGWVTRTNIGITMCSMLWGWNTSLFSVWGTLRGKKALF